MMLKEELMPHKRSCQRNSQSREFRYVTGTGLTLWATWTSGPLPFSSVEVVEEGKGPRRRWWKSGWNGGSRKDLDSSLPAD